MGCREKGYFIYFTWSHIDVGEETISNWGKIHPVSADNDERSNPSD